MVLETEKDRTKREQLKTNVQASLSNQNYKNSKYYVLTQNQTSSHAAPDLNVFIFLLLV